MMARVDRRSFLLGGSAALLLPSPAPAAPTVPQFIDAFTAWYNTAKLPIPLRIDKQDHGVDFTFEGYSSLLKGWAGRGANGNSYELYVSAEYNDDHDILIWPDRCIPEQRSDGWVCATCVQDAPTTMQPIRIFHSAEAIWQDHLFNDLSEWITKTLVPAKYMVFGEYGVIFHRTTRPALA